VTLIVCPDCSREVSDAATACVGCGRPIRSAITTSAGPVRPPARVARQAVLVCPKCGSDDTRKLAILYAEGQTTSKVVSRGSAIGSVGGAIGVISSARRRIGVENQGRGRAEVRPVGGPGTLFGKAKHVGPRRPPRPERVPKALP